MPPPRAAWQIRNAAPRRRRQAHRPHGARRDPRRQGHAVAGAAPRSRPAVSHPPGRCRAHRWLDGHLPRRRRSEPGDRQRRHDPDPRRRHRGVVATASRHAPAAMRDLLGVAAVPRAARRRPLNPRRRPPVDPQTPAFTRSPQVRRDRAEQLVERQTLRAGTDSRWRVGGAESGRPRWRSGASVGAQKPALWRIGRTLPESKRSRPVGAVLRCGHFGDQGSAPLSDRGGRRRTGR